MKINSWYGKRPLDGDDYPKNEREAPPLRFFILLENLDCCSVLSLSSPLTSHTQRQSRRLDLELSKISVVLSLSRRREEDSVCVCVARAVVCVSRWQPGLVFILVVFRTCRHTLLWVSVVVVVLLVFSPCRSSSWENCTRNTHKSHSTRPSFLSVVNWWSRHQVWPNFIDRREEEEEKSRLVIVGRPLLCVCVCVTSRVLRAFLPSSGYRKKGEERNHIFSAVGEECYSLASSKWNVISWWPTGKQREGATFFLFFDKSSESGPHTHTEQKEICGLDVTFLASFALPPRGFSFLNSSFERKERNGHRHTLTWGAYSRNQVARSLAMKKHANLSKRMRIFPPFFLIFQRHKAILVLPLHRLWRF